MSDVAKALRERADDMQRALGKDNPDSHALRETADYVEALEAELHEWRTERFHDPEERSVDIMRNALRDALGLGGDDE